MGINTRCGLSLFYYFCIDDLTYFKSFFLNSDISNKKTTILTSNVSLLKYLSKCFDYRGLIWELAKKDIKVKYAQTSFGILLSILQPVIGLVLFVFLFGRMLNLGSDGSPYPVFVFCGMIAWYYFSILTASTGSALLESQHIIKKVSFPKLILPISKTLSGLAEFMIWLILLIVLLAIYRIVPTYRLLFFPLFLAINMITGLTVGIWMSALSLHRRDVLHIIPYLAGLTIMFTPVFYPRTSIPDNFEFLLYFNPVAGIIQGYRWCITGQEAFSSLYLICFLVVCLLFYSGLHYFKKVEYKIAEKI